MQLLWHNTHNCAGEKAARTGSTSTSGCALGSGRHPEVFSSLDTLIAACTYMYLLPSCNKTLLQTLIGEYKKLKKNVKSSESAVTGESAGVEGRVGVTSSFAQQRREIGVATSNGQKRSNDAN